MQKGGHMPPRCRFKGEATLLSGYRQTGSGGPEDHAQDAATEEPGSRPTNL
jgi:hypothetical protein